MLRIVGLVSIADAQRRFWNGAQPSPFETGPQGKYLGHSLLGFAIAGGSHRARVLVLDIGTPFVELAHQHEDGLQHIQWFEAGYYHRFVILAGAEAVGVRAYDHTDM